MALETTAPFRPIDRIPEPTEIYDFSQYQTQLEKEIEHADVLWGFAFQTYKSNLELDPSGAAVIYNEELTGLVIKGLKDVKIPSDVDIDAIDPTVKTKEEKKKIKNEFKEIRKSKKEAIDSLRLKSPLKSNDINKEAQENTLEKIAERNRVSLGKIRSAVGTSYKSIAKVLGDIEKRKNEGKKISDAERIVFEEEVSRNLSEYQTSMASLDRLISIPSTDRACLMLEGSAVPDSEQIKFVDTINTIKIQVEGVGPADPNSILVKIKTSLDKPFDETKEKFVKAAESMDAITKQLQKIQSDIEEEIKKEKKVDPDNRAEFLMRISMEESNLELTRIDFANAWTKLGIDLMAVGELPTPKQFGQHDALESRDNYLRNDLIVKLKEKVNGHTSPKDQRENAKSLNTRVSDIEKMMKTDYDSLDIGKGYADNQKETYRILIDVEEIAIADMEEELTHLTPVVDDPTKTMIEGVVLRSKERIEKAKEKVEKKRVAKEKEIQEKFESIDKGIEEVESRLRDIARKDAEGKNQFEENKERAGVLQKLWTSTKKYDGGTKYQDHASMVDTLFDPREESNKVKEWIKDLPETNEKELKLKKKMMKKARRLSRRITSAKWRHYFSMDTKNQAKYWGDMARNKTFDIMGNVMDRIVYP